MGEHNEPNRIYIYKLTHDNGGAPCVVGEMFSLAICKPDIRANAGRGDWIFGFAANSLHEDNRLIYIAVVSQPIENGKYYTETKFLDRPDCIYRKTGNGYQLRPDARYHTEHDQRERDLGQSKGWNRDMVLVSDDFRYFGGDCSYDYRNRYPEIRRAVKKLTKKYLVKHEVRLDIELRDLKEDLWRRFKGKKVWGRPSQPIADQSCGGGC